MKLFIDVFGLRLPSYGLMIVVGVILANLIALWILKKEDHNIYDFMIVEAYTFLGAFIGAKLLYIIVSYKEIDWNRIFDLDYFNQIMQGGFVFYGGLIGGLIFAYLAGKMHKIQVLEYVRSYIFLIPFIHSFGRIGCFMAGCCYGVPYDGCGAVIYPEHSLAPSGISLFPVQLVEAALLLLIASVILYVQLKKHWKYTIETYLVLYGVVRFVLENYRYDEERGIIGWFSTSQWISIVLIAIAVGLFVRDAYKKNRVE